jgi:hypothetical protein
VTFIDESYDHWTGRSAEESARIEMTKAVRSAATMRATFASSCLFSGHPQCTACAAFSSHNLLK